ncbi:MAG: AMP-binding protein, partial [Clostridia bacterium]|nr:AMP-binding protein [Clostridia bacterium]
MNFFQKDIETMPRKELEALQLERLKKIVAYCYNNTKFYHDKLDKAGVGDGSKIRQLSDIEYIPFTEKSEFRDNYPFGMVAVPHKDIVRVHASSGTTGKPTVGVYTKQDIDIWSDCVARVCAAGGVTSDDIIQISFGYGLFTGALGLHYGLEKLGAMVIPMSSGNTEKQLMMMRDLGVTGLVATPSYALYLSEAVKEGEYPLDAYKLKLGILGSEPCTPEMRETIEKNLGIYVSDNYGMTELGGPGVSGDCIERDGMHFAEDHF